MWQTQLGNSHLPACHPPQVLIVVILCKLLPKCVLCLSPFQLLAEYSTWIMHHFLYLNAVPNGLKKSCNDLTCKKPKPSFLFPCSALLVPGYDLWAWYLKWDLSKILTDVKSKKKSHVKSSKTKNAVKYVTLLRMYKVH